MKKLSLGQIFYGRGPAGYGVLGASPTGRPFLGAVASLCRAVGSPDRPGEIPTFLLGKREGNAAIMIRACRGAADPTGRATIFFHALVADAASLRSAGIDPFAFAENGTFASVCPSHELPDLVFPDMRTQPSVQTSVRSLELPATISSDRPLDALVRRELGAEALDKNWATFSYNPLPGFDLCVLSSYSPRTGGGTQYAFDGAGVHRLSSETTSDRKAEAASTAGQNPPKRSLLPLIVSLTVNMVLVLALLARGGKGEAGKPVETPPVGEMTESDARAKWESQWKSEWEKTLPPSTPAMTEEEAKATWEARWKSEWEKSLPQAAPAIMTEEEAKATWEAQWKSEWEKSLPPSAPDMTEDEAREKWAKRWRDEWTRTLRSNFEKTLRASRGVWPIDYAVNSQLASAMKSGDEPPEDEKLIPQWKLYQSSKVCSDFIKDFLNPTPQP